MNVNSIIEYVKYKNNATCISARDVGVIIGISPFDTRMSLLLEKCHLRQKNKPFTESMKRGVVLEDEALSEFASYMKINILDIKKPGFTRHPLFNFIGGVPDGIYNDLLIEIKCPSRFTTSEKPPPFYNAQMQIYMQIFNLRVGYYVEYIQGMGLNIKTVVRDDVWWIWILPLVKTFWDEIMYWRNSNIIYHPYVQNNHVKIC